MAKYSLKAVLIVSIPDLFYLSYFDIIIIYNIFNNIKESLNISIFMNKIGARWLANSTLGYFLQGTFYLAENSDVMNMRD